MTELGKFEIDDPTIDWVNEYMRAADRNVVLAEKVGQLETELRAEKMAHLIHCRELEAARTLADYRQEKIERREGTERRTDFRSDDAFARLAALPAMAPYVRTKKRRVRP